MRVPRRPLRTGDQAGRPVVSHEVFRSLGYETAHHGNGRWNGVAIASRVGLDQVATGLGSIDDEQGDAGRGGRVRGSAGGVGLCPERSLTRQ